MSDPVYVYINPNPNVSVTVSPLNVDVTAQGGGVVDTSQYVTTGQTGAFYLANNPSGFITGVNTGSFITTGQTGAFYPASNPNGFITSSSLTPYVLASQTGSFITSGQTGLFYPANNPSGFITGVSGYVTTGQTGIFATTGSLVSFASLNGNQTIHGENTFDGSIDFQGGKIFASDGDMYFYNTLYIGAGENESASDFPIAFAIDGSARFNGVVTAGNLQASGLTVNGTETISYSNTDITNTSGANVHLLLNNPDGGGQTVVATYFGGSAAPAAKWRTDFNGNISWVANNHHDFYIGGDYGVGTAVFSLFSSQITANVNIEMGSNLIMDSVSSPVHYIDLTNGIIVANSSTTVIDFTNSSLNSNVDGSQSVDWQNRELFSDSNFPSVDWNNKILFGTWKVDTLTANSSITVAGNNVITTNDTGNFYSSSNPNHYVKSGTLNIITPQVRNVLISYTGFLNWSAANAYEYQLQSNSKFLFTGMTNGQTINVAITQIGTSATITWPTGSGLPTLPPGVSGVKWQNGVIPTQSTGNNKTDIYTFTNINNIIYGSVIQGY